MTEQDFMQQIHKAFGDVIKQVDLPEGKQLLVEIGLSDRPDGRSEITICTGCTVDGKTRNIVPLREYLINKRYVN